ncbi:MAG: prepilin-type N-terminal cleavage/methylation domain-containing protein [Pseudomonadota bacterium]|nr:prepilin-type N-terminal cleavage/methylation domain-containing protein [Pseudomonadota bacterium]
MNGDLRPQRRRAGFTLIELLVVMAIIASLLSIAVPRYFASLEKSRETILRSDLAQMRDSIDKYYGDLGKYPDELQDLVTKHYLRAIPEDPITRSTTTWVPVAPDDGSQGQVFDVKSGAQGTGQDGTSYAEW